MASALSSLEAERTLFEFTHPEVGEMVAERWDLPARYVAGIAHHHDPVAAGDERPFCAVIGLSDQAAHARPLRPGPAWHARRRANSAARNPQPEPEDLGRLSSASARSATKHRGLCRGHPLRLTETSSRAGPTRLRRQPPGGSKPLRGQGLAPSSSSATNFYSPLKP
jgi:hypothetical protein